MNYGPACQAIMAVRSNRKKYGLSEPRQRPYAACRDVALCEHAFVSIKGGSYANFQRALKGGNLTLIRAAATELPARRG